MWQWIQSFEKMDVDFWKMSLLQSQTVLSNVVGKNIGFIQQQTIM